MLGIEMRWLNQTVWTSYLAPVLVVSTVLGLLLLLPNCLPGARSIAWGSIQLDALKTGATRSGRSGGTNSRTLDSYDEEAIRRRATAAVLGALVSDAATMGLHWIYDLDKLNSLVMDHARQDEPAFFQPPSSPYYEYESGSLSPYGDELMPVLQYMTIGPGGQLEGSLDGPGFAQFLAHYYANYSGRLNKSSRSMMMALLQGGRGWPECGDPRDTQANNFVKVIPLVARYAGRPGLGAAVDAAVRAQQNNEEAVMYGLVAALVLERVVLGSSIAEAVEWAADGAPGSGVSLSRTTLEALQAVVRHRHAGTPLRELLYAPGSASKAGPWGPSCANPGALQAALLGALQASDRPSWQDSFRGVGVGGGILGYSRLGGGPGWGVSGGSDMNASFARGVRTNILLGGDSCSRGVLLGALLAAQAGPSAIPFAWRSQTRVYHSIEVLVEQLLDFRTGVKRRAQRRSQRRRQG